MHQEHAAAWRVLHHYLCAPHYATCSARAQGAAYGHDAAAQAGIARIGCGIMAAGVGCATHQRNRPRTALTVYCIIIQVEQSDDCGS
jgi:hypothetical protein